MNIDANDARKLVAKNVVRLADKMLKRLDTDIAVAAKDGYYELELLMSSSLEGYGPLKNNDVFALVQQRLKQRSFTAIKSGNDKIYEKVTISWKE